MPCHVRSATVSHHRRPPSAPKPSPKPLAVLDLAKARERQVHDYLHRATTGPHPCWWPLGMRRAGHLLLCAVQWAQLADGSNAYAAIEFDFGAQGGVAMRWRDHETAAEAQADIRRSRPAASQQAGCHA